MNQNHTNVNDISISNAFSIAVDRSKQSDNIIDKQDTDEVKENEYEFKKNMCLTCSTYPIQSVVNHHNQCKYCNQEGLGARGRIFMANQNKQKNQQQANQACTKKKTNSSDNKQEKLDDYDKNKVDTVAVNKKGPS